MLEKSTAAPPARLVHRVTRGDRSTNSGEVAEARGTGEPLLTETRDVVWSDLHFRKILPAEVRRRAHTTKWQTNINVRVCGRLRAGQ